MSKLRVERKGGFGGFGGKNSHLQSRGEIDINTLNNTDKKTVENLFKSKGKEEGSPVTDGFRYKISRSTPDGTESIEVGEEKIPAAIRQCVKDEII